MRSSVGEERAGILAGLGAYGLWGLLPLWLRLVDDVDPLEILLHRIVWSLVVVLGLLVVLRRLPMLGDLARSRVALPRLAAAALFISVNWLTYIWAMNNEHVVDAALGYYVNPLITVALGVVVLGEHLRTGQRAAIALGGLAVVVLTVASGTFPWISLVLACSFASYGFLKKAVGAGALASLAVETALLAPLAIVGLVLLGRAGELAFLDGGGGRDLLLLSMGVVTAGPLLLFATAATRIPLSLLGLLQYLTPTMQLLCGVVLLGESLSPARLAGFVLVWLALVVLGVDMISHERRNRRAVVVAPVA